MTSPITVLLKISIWHQMDISTNVDINTYTLSLVRTHTHTFTRARTRTHKHLVTVNRCQGHCGGSQVFSSVPYQKQYIVHTLLTQNAEVRIYKLHMHTHARAHTRTHTHIHKHKTSETTKDLILSLSLSTISSPLVRKTNVLALILPS